MISILSNTLPFLILFQIQVVLSGSMVVPMQAADRTLVGVETNLCLHFVSVLQKTQNHFRDPIDRKS